MITLGNVIFQRLQTQHGGLRDNHQNEFPISVNICYFKNLKKFL